MHAVLVAPRGRLVALGTTVAPRTPVASRATVAGLAALDRDRNVAHSSLTLATVHSRAAILPLWSTLTLGFFRHGHLRAAGVTRAQPHAAADPRMAPPGGYPVSVG